MSYDLNAKKNEKGVARWLRFCILVASLRQTEPTQTQNRKTMKEYKYDSNWSFSAMENDRDSMDVFIEHRTKGSASLACAEGEGETDGGQRIPSKIIDACDKWIESEGINY